MDPILGVFFTKEVETITNHKIDYNLSSFQNFVLIIDILGGLPVYFDQFLFVKGDNYQRRVGGIIFPAKK
ncbi:MAG: hypothetical protein IPG24_28455 [Leptospiraceae bacterium]|nr:hypothetical protein [Leptospiraceae bacterium]